MSRRTTALRTPRRRSSAGWTTSSRSLRVTSVAGRRTAAREARPLSSEDRMDSQLPLIRVVVLNFDGGAMTLECLDSVLATEWPADRLEIVLVDNGSLDDVAERVRRDYPN